MDKLIDFLAEYADRDIAYIHKRGIIELRQSLRTSTANTVPKILRVALPSRDRWFLFGQPRCRSPDAQAKECSDNYTHGDEKTKRAAIEKLPTLRSSGSASNS